MKYIVENQEKFEEMTTIFPEEVMEIVEKVKLLAIKIVSDEIINNDSHIYSSKFGGIPYFPKDIDYPRNDEGEPLALLTQFNLDEMFSNPEILEACQRDKFLKLYPKTGMLSFFHDILDDEMLGLEEKNKNGSRVYYFPEIIKDNRNEAYDMHKELCAADYYKIGIPDAWKVSRSITTHLKYTLPTDIYNGPRSDELDSYRDLYLTNTDYRKFISDIEDSAFDWHDSYIGGYPGFTHGDLRSEDESRSITLLDVSLLDYYDAGGYAYFFISEKDLKNLNFSNLIVTSVYS